MDKVTTSIILLGVVVFLIMILKVIQLLRKGGSGDSHALYDAKGALLTPAELKFLGVLDQVVGTHYRIMAQVRLADVIKVKGNLDKSARSSAFNRIKAKHLDFVACDPSDMTVKFAIELDDSSHNRPNRRARDAFLEEAMKSAGVPLYRFAVKREYDPQEVHQVLFTPNS